MRFLTNMSRWEVELACGKGNPLEKYNLIRLHSETPDEAVARLREYLQGKVVGDPAPGEVIPVEEMKRHGLVGIYAPDEKGKL